MESHTTLYTTTTHHYALALFCYRISSPDGDIATASTWYHLFLLLLLPPQPPQSPPFSLPSRFLLGACSSGSRKALFLLLPFSLSPFLLSSLPSLFYFLPLFLSFRASRDRLAFSLFFFFTRSFSPSFQYYTRNQPWQF